MRYDEKTIRVPDEVHEAVLQALGQIENMNMEKTGGHKAAWTKTYKAAAIMLACIVAFSTTSVAAIHFVRARMEAMDAEQQQKYWEQVYRNRMGRDTTSRPLSQEERERLEKQAVFYEAGVFPEGEIRVIAAEADYDGKGIAYLEETGTFYLPEAELTDEELLQILDFRAKRSYSLSEVNVAVEQAGEDLTEALSEVVKWDIPEEVIVYEGEEISAICAGKDCIWLGGRGSILRMAVGGSSAEVFCQELDESCEVRALCERADGGILAASWDREKEACRNRLWMISASGQVEQSIELAHIQGFVRKIAVDKNGNIYLKGGAGTNLGISVLDASGQLVAKPEREGYRADFWWAYCLADTGEIQLLSREKESGSLDVLAIDPQTWEIRVAAQNVYPDDKLLPDVMMSCGEAYLFWGYDGLWRYDKQTNEYSRVKAPEEYPVTYDGIKSCVAEDGSICLYFWWDGKGFCFYYDNIGN